MLIKNDCRLLRRLNATDTYNFWQPERNIEGGGGMCSPSLGKEMSEMIVEDYIGMISLCPPLAWPGDKDTQRNVESSSEPSDQQSRVRPSQRQHNQDYIHTSLSATPYNADRSLILFDENCPTKVWKWNLSVSKVRTIF